MTSYLFPTWADITARVIGAPFENWGISGGGNVSILNRLIEADVRHSFTEDDLIMVMWTSPYREDRFFATNGWLRVGNVYSQAHFDERFMRKYWSDEGAILQSCNAIAACRRIVKSKLIMTHMCPMDVVDGYGYQKPSEEGKRIIDHYSREREGLGQSLHEFFDSKWIMSRQGPEYLEYHPLPSKHLAFAEANIFPVLNLKASDEVREWCALWDRKVEEAREPSDVSKQWVSEQHLPKKEFGHSDRI